jgi:Na+/H+ antiporter NhaD/arsenite permease-like protein
VQRIPGLPLNRPAASLLGAVAMVALAGMPLDEAYASIDADILVFLLGLMIVVAYLEEARFFASGAVPDRAGHGIEHRLVLTITGNPQNMVVGLRGGFGFLDFAWQMLPVAAGALLLLSNLVSNMAAALLWAPIVPQFPVRGMCGWCWQ